MVFILEKLSNKGGQDDRKLSCLEPELAYYVPFFLPRKEKLYIISECSQVSQIKAGPKVIYVPSFTVFDKMK